MRGAGHMRRIDEIHLEHPFMGSRQIVRVLRRRGLDVGRLHVRTLMQKMSLHVLAPQPRVLAGGLPKPGARDAVRCAHALVCGARWGGSARHWRQHEDGGGQGEQGQGPNRQRPFCRHVRALFV
ncbi:MAG: hypothetical protein B7Z83_05690 [Thiomonas sp. 20-64-5]|nr:MAG: hypothetical protein B7Z83_05690 [Thiomonas sp. 20-64-5]